MPDLASHALIAYFVSLPFKKRYKVAVFLLGAILPDLFSESLFYFIRTNRQRWLSYPTHSPIYLFLLCLVISLLFEQSKRRVVFICLFAGSGLHIFLDGLQKHFDSNLFWFFPFSWHSFSLGLFWPENTLFVVPFLTIALGIVLFFKRNHGKRTIC